MLENKNLLKTLEKKAKGFSADEITEEYVVNEDGNLVLSKRKVMTKYFPPDTGAIKSVLDMDELSSLSDEELEKEKQRLLMELANQQKSEVINERKTK